MKRDTPWTRNKGDAQSAYFAQIAASNTPGWLRDLIFAQPYSLLDIGCAEGDGTITFANALQLAGTIRGIDAQREHIAEANRIYGARAGFRVASVMDKKSVWDLTFCSNVLEHVKNPDTVLRRILERTRFYAWILVPFNEQELLPAGKLHTHGDFYDGHVNRFTSFRGNYSVEGVEAKLVCQTVIDTRASGFWHGDQLLAIYERERIRKP